MKILITGGAGFIGSMVANCLLQQGHQIRVVDVLWFDEKVPMAHSSDSNYEFIQADLYRDNLLDRYLEDVDMVIHAAAVVGEPASKKFPELTRQVNYDMTIKLIEHIRNTRIRGFVFFSTCSNYGVTEGLTSEEAPLQPLSLYAETKVGVEKYLMERSDGIDWVICRLSTVYGVSPRIRFDLTVNDFAMNAYKNKHLDIFLPLSYRPYIHVFDVANVIAQMIDKFPSVKNNIFNVGFNGENYQKIQIARIIERFIPDMRIDIVKNGADLRDYQVDFSKLQQYLGVKNKFTVADGVEEILRLLDSRIITDPYQKYYYNTTPNITTEQMV